MSSKQTVQETSHKSPEEKSRKQLLEEMRQYNEDLDQHLPNFDFDYLRDFSFDDQEDETEKSTDEEYFSLLANNIMELRTEVALTRKNLVSDVEGMIVKRVGEQQNKFFEQMKKHNNSIIMDLKETLTNHMESLTEDINALKRRYTELSMQNENIEKSMDEIRGDVNDMKNQMGTVGTDLHKNTSFSKVKLDELQEKIDYLSHDFSRSRSSTDNSLDKISKKLAHLEYNFESLMYPDGQTSSKSYQIEMPESIRRYKDSENNASASDLFDVGPQQAGGNQSSIQTSADKRESDSSALPVSASREDSSGMDAPPSQEVPEGEQRGSKSRFDKLLDIDEKLQKLDSLR